MTGLIEAIDTWFADKYSDFTQKLFGFCELVHRTTKEITTPIPATITGTSDRKYVTLDDRYQIITWFRWTGQMISSDEIEGQNWSFGFQEAPVKKPVILWVIAIRVELGEEMIFDIASALPKGFAVLGYQVSFIDRSTIVVDPDHETIYKTELGDTVYEKHRFTWNIYTISFSADLVPNSACENTGCCDDSLTTEAGECLITENG